MSPAPLCTTDVVQAFEAFAPAGLAEEWDAVGLQIGNPTQECRTVAVALDLTRTTLDEAMARKADLIIVHHPILFRPLKSIRYDQPPGELIQQICQANISVYAAHTNLDATVGGLNDHLANLIDLNERRSLLPPTPTTPESFRDKIVGLGRVGTLAAPTTLQELASRLHAACQPEALRIIGEAAQEIQTVALCTGSGGSLVHEAIHSGADCYVTGDVKYHQALDAEAAGMAVLDVGHYATEIASIGIIRRVLEASFPNELNIVSLESARDPLRPFA